MNEIQKPVARQQNLVIQEMTDETLVYDLKTNKAHCLNKTAAAVWKSCDGNNTIAEIAGLIKGTNGAAVGEDFIWLAIDQLNEKDLLAEEMPAKFNGQTRREVIKKVGLAAIVALPIVTSLVAPTVASAGSTCPAGMACTCTLNMTCMTAGGCACNSGTGTSTCPSQCTGGCPCTVPQGQTTCTGTCT